MSSPNYTTFWKNIKVGQNDNSPDEYAKEKYAKQGNNILKGLKKLNLENKDISILEIGCNVGRNLNFLFNNDYKNLSGIEINNEAIKLCKEIFKTMCVSDTVKLYNGRLYDFLPNHTNSYDVVFSMAVLMHIDDEERQIIYDYLKKNAKYVIFVEPINETQKKIWNGRMFNIFDYDIHMKQRGFSQISREKATGGLEKNYEMITFKNLNLA